MRAVVQRVEKASVSVGGDLVSEIGKGLLVLVGYGPTDGPKDVEFMSRKILNVKNKGNNLDFSKGMPPATARDFHAVFLDSVRSQYAPDKVKDGVFGAKMSVSLVNDGPVTIDFDSDPRKDGSESSVGSTPRTPAAAVDDDGVAPK